MSIDSIKEAQAGVVAFISESGNSQHQIAMECGLEDSVLSQFLRNTYPGNMAKVADTLNKYLMLAKERLNIPETRCFYKGLGNTKVVLAAANLAHRHCGIVLIRGDSGAGKTTALQYYVSQNAGVLFVTADSGTKTASAILSEIAAASGKRMCGNKQRLMKSLVDYLRGTKRLLIIDEADQLTLDALQAVRSLNDKAGIGIVLAGNNKLYQQMVSGVRGGEFDQIRTRILLKPDVRNEYTESEMHGVFPDSDDQYAMVLKGFANKTSLREAAQLYSFAKECAKVQGCKVSAAFLKKIMEEIK